MAFGINRVELIGRLGADVTVNHLASGGRVANLSIATDESFVDKSGQRVDRTEWHRVVTFQDGLIGMLERHAKKGRLVHAEGKLQTRRWTKDGEDSDRFSTEILVVPGHRLQFLDKPNGNAAQAPADGATVPANGAAPQREDADLILGSPSSRLPTRAAAHAVAFFCSRLRVRHRPMSRCESGASTATAVPAEPPMGPERVERIRLSL